MRHSETIVKLLNRMGVQLIEPYFAKCWFDMIVDVLGVAQDCIRPHTAQISLQPNVQPLAHGHFGGFYIGSFFGFYKCLAQFFLDFGFIFPRGRMLFQLSGFGVLY